MPEPMPEPTPVPTPELTITGARIQSEDADAVTLAVRLANDTGAAVHVWATPRYLSYTDGLLTLRLAEAEPPPPGIEIISHHPRVPDQIVIPVGAVAALKVRVPRTLHSTVLDRPGLGGTVASQDLGAVSDLDVTIAYAPTPFQPTTDQGPDEFIEALRSHGAVVSARVPVEPRSQEPRESQEG